MSVSAVHSEQTKNTRNKKPCGQLWVDCECMYSDKEIKLRDEHGTGNRVKRGSKRFDVPVVIEEPSTPIENKVKKKVKKSDRQETDNTQPKLPEGRTKPLGKLEQICKGCGRVFRRPKKRGRPPVYCPKCKS